MIIKALLMILVNFILYLGFGAILTCKEKNAGDRRIPLRLFGGFFLYYGLFTLFAIPLTYRWRPLSHLSHYWCGAVAVIMIISLIFCHRVWKEDFLYLRDFCLKNKLFLAGLGLLLAIQLLLVLYSYQFTLDAAYYVANVTTSLQTDSLNIYDPYTGDWQDHFEMRYFFATYPLQDAVVCFLTGIPALVQTKGIMASMVLILTNLLYLFIGRELLGGEDKNKLLGFMFFAGLINFFFISIYTSSNFLLTRTYEGKSILGNIILPAIFYIYIRIRKEDENPLCRIVLFVICFGSTVISNSANMLVPATLAVLFLPYIAEKLLEKKYKRALVNLITLLLCMLPGLVLMLVYVAYVKGKFVFYTYPR